MTITHLPRGDAYKRLRTELLSGQFQAGEKLVTQHLADRLGLSRTPIREALVRLEENGLVTHVANQGYSLRTFSLRDVRNLFEARRIIEVSNVELAALRATEDNLQQMRETLERCAAYLQEGKPIELQKTARQFHRIIATSSGNVQLVAMFDQINDLVLLFGLTLLRSSPARAEEILNTNQVILRSIASGNSEAARDAMQQHLARAHQHFMNSLSTLEMDLKLDFKSLTEKGESL